MNNNLKEILLKIKENEFIEIKKSSGNLPKDFWETYSAFSNTDGGTIILGINEGEEINELIGVSKPQVIIDDIWNGTNNPMRVSYNVLSPQDIKVEIIDDTNIIFVNVNEAPNNKKPVFLNNNFSNAYIRRGTADQKANAETIQILFRNSNPHHDSNIVRDCTLEDLDVISITSFKETVTSRHPDRGYEAMSPSEFLVNLGYIINKNDNYQIKTGTLLLLGKYNSIKEVFPQFQMDFFNRLDISSRWIDRVATDDLFEYQMNIYNFFSITFEKIMALNHQSFKLDKNNIRVQPSTLNIAIREALVNCIAHADYHQSFPSVRIEALPGCIIFKNPGKMLVSLEQFSNGGESRPRNDVIFGFFRHLGMAEKQGYGGSQIFRTAVENNFKIPDITTSLEETVLTIWNVDYIEGNENLNENEKELLRVLYEFNILSFSEILSKTNLSEYYARLALDTLIKNHLVKKTGKGRATKYLAERDFKEMVTKIHLAFNEMMKS